MTEYKKKKKLIEDNGDIYISDYDKNLSYEALSQIVNAKKEYAEGAKNNDKSMMTSANNKANAIRAKYGSYTGGEFGNEYHPFSKADYSYGDYSSKYEDELDRLYDSIREAPEQFSYDYEKDPVYLAYKSVYDTKGDKAYERAMAKNSLKTGGMQNTNAQSAAMQAMNYYNSQLAAVIPELYEAAYERYYNAESDKYDRLFDSYKAISDREQRDYDRYLDNLSLKRDERDYNTELAEKERDRIYNRYENLDRYDYELDTQKSRLDHELDMQKSKLDSENKDKRYELVYNLIRDMAEDEKWKNEYNLDAFTSLYPAYSGNLGSGDVLSYARQLFGNPNLTLDDLYNLLGI